MWKPLCLARAALLTGALMALSACADLDAVNKWASAASSVGQVKPLVTDYVSSPTRLAEFYPDAKAAFETRRKTREGQAKTIEGVATVLSEYMSAVAAVSKGEAFEGTKDVKSIFGAVSDLGVADKGTLDPLGGIVSVLAKQATSLWRERKVRELVEKANDPIQRLLAKDGNFRKGVIGGFALSARLEEAAAKGAFTAAKKTGQPSRAAKLALQYAEADALADVAQRKKAIADYDGILAKVAKGHQDLFDGAADLSNKQLAKRLIAYAKELQGDVLKLIKK